jgi:small-conductance mechanosensitive channel
MTVGNILGIDLYTMLSLIIIAVVAVALERIFTRYLSRLAKRAKLEPSAANNLVLTFRILILIGALLALSRAGGLSPELIVAISAIGGAALGFASQKTIGNFIAGLYLLAARPFKVEDYVRIGTVEGIVQEVTINYTKILTIGNNIVSISNLQILDRDITSRVPTQKIAEIFEEVFQRHVHTLPKKPSYMLTRSSAFERNYTVYLYVEHPEDIFTLRPQIAEEVFKRWDMERAKAQP